MPKIEKRNFPILIGVIILVFALGVSLRLVGQQIRLLTGAAGENSKISFASNFANTSLTTTVGNTLNIPVWIDTNTAGIGGIDVLVRFDRSKLRLDSITPNPLNNTNLTLKTFAPVVSTNVSQFDTARVISSANSSGLIEFGAVTFQATPDPGTITSPFNGVAQLAMLGFTALASDPGSQVRFDAVQNSTTDTNMVTTGTVQDLFSNIAWNTADNRISEATVVINTTGTTPSPTTTAPSATPTTVIIPTATPTTAQITPSPTSGTGANVNFQIKFQNISSTTANKPNKLVTVVLKQGSTTISTFTDVNTVADKSTGNYSGTLTGVNPGSYDVYIKGPVHLNKKVTTTPITIAAGTNTLNWTSIPLLVGDVTQDNTIQLSDITGVIAVWNQSTTPVNDTNRLYDLDESSTISLSDVTAIIANWTTSVVNGD